MDLKLRFTPLVTPMVLGAEISTSLTQMVLMKPDWPMVVIKKRLTSAPTSPQQPTKLSSPLTAMVIMISTPSIRMELVYSNSPLALVTISTPSSPKMASKLSLPPLETMVRMTSTSSTLVGLVKLDLPLTLPKIIDRIGKRIHLVAEPQTFLVW